MTVEAEVTELNAVVEEAAKNVVEFKGEKYELPDDFNDANGDVLWLLEKEKPTLALEALLGDEQFAKYRAGKPKVKDLNDFLEKCFEVMGSDTGK